MGEDAAVDREVDVLECNGDVAGVRPVKDDGDSDATEYSSSFGDTCSGSDSDLCLDQGGVEVDSVFAASNGNAAALGRLGRMFKRKKVAAHWRKFISPLMWRCQWLELRMKELLSKASNYEKELASLKNEKNICFEMIRSDGSVSRSVPLSCQNPRKNVMKRRKRKRYEDILDASSYMSSHHIFSYYENQSIEINTHLIDADCDCQVNESMKRNDVHSLLGGSKDDAEWLALEQILLNIQSAQTRVFRLRSHLDKVISEKAKESSFAGNLLVNYVENPACSPRENVHMVSDDSLPTNVLSYGDAAEQNIVESTLGLFYAASNRLAPRQLQDLDENTDDILIDNQVAKDEYQNFENVNDLQEQSQEFVKKEAKTPLEGQSSAPVTVDQDLNQEIEKTAVPHRVAVSSYYSRKYKGRKPKRRRQGGKVHLQKQILMSQLLGKADDVHIDNQPAGEKHLDSEKVIHPIEQNQESAEEEAEPHLEQETNAPMAMKQEQSSEIVKADVPLVALLKACNTRRRGGRKPKKRARRDLNADDVLMDKHVAGKEHHSEQVVGKECHDSKRVRHQRRPPSKCVEKEAAAGSAPVDMNREPAQDRKQSPNPAPRRRKQPPSRVEKEAGCPPRVAAKPAPTKEPENASAPPAVVKPYNSGRRGGLKPKKRAAVDVAAALNNRKSERIRKLSYKIKLSKKRS